VWSCSVVPSGGSGKRILASISSYQSWRRPDKMIVRRSVRPSELIKQRDRLPTDNRETWLRAVYLAGTALGGSFESEYSGADKFLARPGRKQIAFPAFYRTLMFITTFTTVHYLSAPYPNQSIPLLITLMTSSLCFLPCRAMDLSAPGSLGSNSHVTWFLHFRLMHRAVSTCSDVSESVLPTFLGWLKWILNWCSGRKFPSYGGERRCGTIFWNIRCSKMAERKSLQDIQLNRWTWLEQWTPWHPDFLLHFTCVSAHAIWLVR